MEVSENVGGTGVTKMSAAVSENAHEVSIEKTATGSIEQESSLKRSVEQTVEKSVQQTSSQSIQKSVQQSVMVSSTTTQRKVATSSSVQSSNIRIGQSTEIEEIEF